MSVLTLRMQRYIAMLELVEGSIIVLIDLNELLLESFQLIFILWGVLDTHVELRL